MELRELVARSLFNDEKRLRMWDSAKLWMKQTYLKKADEALRRAGVENVKLKTKVTLTENVSRTK